MTKMFDVVLIGAGPAAVAALDALRDGLRVAVVTGASADRSDNTWLHSKIWAVAADRGEAPGVADALTRSFAPKKPLFSTAIEGGLANYWGQQFWRYGAGDPYPTEVFPHYGAYLEDCAAVERLFRLEGGEDLAAPDSPGFAFRVPRILVGSAANPSVGLLAMRDVFASLPKAALFSTRAALLTSYRGVWQAYLANGERIAAPKILLAAGVVGTARLLMASFSSISGAQISDHAPWMFYLMGLSRLYAARPVGAPKHFNSLTIEKVVDGKSKIFASLYNMSHAGLSLLLTSTIGRWTPLARNVPSPPGASLLQPMQVWTKQTFASFAIDARSSLVTAVPQEDPPDSELEESKAMLRALGGRILHGSRTSEGYGFHYHALKLVLDTPRLTPVAEALMRLTGGAVQCIDASVLPNIGLRPHSLTAMATARRLVLG